MLSNSCSSESSTSLGITIWMRPDTTMCKVLSGEVSILVKLGADGETHPHTHTHTHNFTVPEISYLRNKKRMNE